ncbi:GMC oxidoreductase [Jannaschia sp. W003]|uniref:GMC oxidoreductase n=1 Tax=Jannaschia sp. W003 TaxID=2867012 RepID=UPI0021A5D50D|nr:GMC oxidoreductase [Jannaschia sp. W003]UWQ21561.1 hypothetical protein K3554_00550 [Jannaschia sp. W003]
MGRVTLEAAARSRYDLLVLGAGAAGCTLADAAARAGLRVLLAERGGALPSPAPVTSDIPDGVPHDADARTVRQGLGGTLGLWGGRCIPLEPDDLRDRPGRLGGWPIAADDYAAWIGAASAWLGATPRFDAPHPAGWPRDPEGAIHLDRVERLVGTDLDPGLRRRLLHGADGPNLLLGAQGVGLDWSEAGDAVRAVRLRPAAGGGGTRAVGAEAVALACGGLQVARLLLLEARAAPGRFAGSAWLGRGYAGHLTGSVATVRPRDPAAAAAFRYHRAGGPDPQRRRLLLLAEHGTDVAFWLRNLPLEDPGHRSGELSAKALVRCSRRGGGAAAEHLRNLAADPAGGLRGIGSALRTRTLRARHAERLAVRPGAAYRLVYHAEHLPDRDSHVRLADRLAEDGLPALHVAFRYGRATIDGLVDAHLRVAPFLERDGFAAVEMPRSRDALAESIRGQARDGYHQIGLTRMARDPSMGVVDGDGRVFGTRNLHVASASTFPTASQANPTLTIVALALRMAAHLAGARARARAPASGRAAR